jgi:hypothetical protein
MSNDFLKKYKKQPRPEFARSLHSKLLKQGEVQMKPVKPILRYAFIALLAAAVSVAAVPAARARAGEVFEKVADILFISSDTLPGNGETPVVMMMVDGEANPEDVMPLMDAKDELSFTTLSPAWLPEGYILNENEAGVLRISDDVAVGLHIKWTRGEEQIDFYAIRAEDNEPLGAGQQTEVNGNPAIISTMDKISSLTWIQDGVRYTLSGVISAEDMIRMAKSAQ